MLTKTAKGAGWMVGWQVTTRVLGFLTTLLLARLLAPADFGVVAIAMSLVQALETLTFLGVEEALIRERAPSRELYDTGFTISLLRNLVIALLLCAAAAPLAGLFADPRLTNVFLALAFGVAVSGFGNIGMVDYRRSFAFVMAFRQMIVPRLISLVLTVGLGLWLHSYWALVVGVVSMRLAQVVAGYVMHPYRPRLSLSLWRSLIGYSLWSMAQTAAVVLRDRMHLLIIGHLLGPPAVGVYSLAEDIALMPGNDLLAPLSRVAFSSFAATQRQPGEAVTLTDDPAHTYLRLVSTTALLAVPMGWGLSLTADAVVALGFGPGWSGAIPVMRVLGVVGSMMVFAYMGTTLFFAHARMAASFGVTCAAAVTRLLLLLLILPYGLVGAALAMAGAEAVETLAYMVLIARHYGLRRRAVLRDTWRCLLATTAMAAALWFTGLGWAPVAGSVAAAARLAMAVPLGVVVYLAVLLGCWQALGRPAGPEADCLRLAQRAMRRLGAGRWGNVAGKV